MSIRLTKNREMSRPQNITVANNDHFQTSRPTSMAVGITVATAMLCVNIANAVNTLKYTRHVFPEDGGGAPNTEGSSSAHSRIWMMLVLPENAEVGKTPFPLCSRDMRDVCRLSPDPGTSIAI
jgi:hypothetical protein